MESVPPSPLSLLCDSPDTTRLCFNDQQRPLESKQRKELGQLQLGKTIIYMKSTVGTDMKKNNLLPQKNNR